MQKISGKNLKILLISVDPNSAVGGIATWTKGYLKYCLQNHIVCDLVDTAKVNIVGSNKVINEFIRTRNIISNLKSKIKSGGVYDVVHLNTSIGFYGIIRDYFLARIVAKNNIPLVLNFHCDVAYWDQSKIKQFFLHKIVKIAKCCVVLCSSSQKHLYQSYHKKSVVVPNFIELTNVQNNKEIRKNISKVLYTGRVSEAKGSVELFELAKYFPDKSFLLIGKVILNLSEIEVPANIVLAGEKQHSEVLEYLDKADIFILPSHSEGFSLALTEAMAKGIPCLVTDVGANKDMISGGAGIVVSAGDIEAMIQAMKQMEEQAVRREMSEKAICKVKEEYGIESVMEQFVSLYQGVINNENE